MTTRHLSRVLACLALLACEGELAVEGPDGGRPPDAPLEPPMDAGGPRDGGPRIDSGPSSIDASPLDAGSPSPGTLAPDLRVVRVDLYQTVRVPLAAEGAPADRAALPVVAGRETLFRIHAGGSPDWRPRPITAVLEIDADGFTRRFIDVRSPALPSDDSNPDSLFSVRVPASAMVPGARFRVRLEAEAGVASAPDAMYPRDGVYDSLEVVPSPPLVLVLVPFRYDTDGSGRLPDLGEVQLARYRDELTSRFPYAEVELRVHPVEPWSRSTRLGGNVDWGAVNSRLIGLRDAAGAPGHEYWYGLMSPHETRASYCASVWGSCVTGQSYVATLRGARVGSGLGFGELDSVGTLAHEVGHLHGRFHAPCGTSGTDSSYPYPRGVIGVWGWDRRDGTVHSPGGSTDLLGYCEPQWISDYNYRAFYERARDLGVAYSARLEVAPRPHLVLRIERGEASWDPPIALRELPGEVRSALLLDGEGTALESVDVTVLQHAHGDAFTILLPEPLPPRSASLALPSGTVPLP